MLIRFWKACEKILQKSSYKYELGRWNSHIHKQEPWEYYLDMANYDNCCCSRNIPPLYSKPSSLSRNDENGRPFV